MLFIYKKIVYEINKAEGYDAIFNVHFSDLAKGDIDAIDEAEKEFSGIEQNISQAQEVNTKYHIAIVHSLQCLPSAYKTCFNFR